MASLTAVVVLPCSCYLWSGNATTKTATDAFTACQSAGGVLAVYPSYDMQKAVEEHFVAKGQWQHDDDMWWVVLARPAGLCCASGSSS